MYNLPGVGVVLGGPFPFSFFSITSAIASMSVVERPLTMFAPVAPDGSPSACVLDVPGVSLLLLLPPVAMIILAATSVSLSNKEEDRLVD